MAMAWAVGLSSLLFASPLRLHRRAHYVMGTIFEISAYGENPETTAAAIEEAFAVIREADHVMSSYRKDSDLMVLNARAASGFVPIRPDLFEVIRAAVMYAELTDGAFDITVGPLMRAWGFFQARGRIPSPPERSVLRAIVGSRHIQLDATRRAVRFDVPGVEIDLGGIAKGWAVDRAADVLRARGIQSALIDAGTSSLYAVGAPPGEEAWPVGLRDPLRADRVAAVVGLKDMSLSTSGGYERYVRVRGKRYSHIMNPKTGWPVADMLSTTVVAPTAMESDALSTAVFVMGADRGRVLLAARGLEGLFIYRQRRRIATEVAARRDASQIYLASAP